MKVLQKITVPQESVNDQYLTVVGVPFAPGDAVKVNDIVIELETSKAVITLEAEVEGFVEYLCSLDDEVGINKIIVQILDEPITTVTSIDAVGSITKGAEFENVEQATMPVAIPLEYETAFSKMAEQIIVENGLAKSAFRHLDFVTADMVRDYINPAETQIIQSVSPIKREVARPNDIPVNLEKVTLQKIKPGKKREIEYLSSVQGNNLVSTIYMDIDLGSFFESVNPAMRYFKDSFLPVFTYEASRLLIKYPVLNAYFADNTIAIYKDINIGVAMDMDDGLKVVNVHDTAGKNMVEIEDVLFKLSNKYLDKTLETADLTDITFTITDLSSQGAYFFTPLVNKGNSAILGIAKTDAKLNRVMISLSFDHRVTEGKTATNFLFELKERIESYALVEREKNRTDKVFCYKCMKTLKDDLNDKGFIKVISAKGDDKFICDSCLFNY